MKLGLAVEGGASRGYFSAGAMDGLLDAGILADYVVGSSAGIANAVSYMSRQSGRNRTIATQYVHDKRYMGMRHLLSRKNKSYYNLDFAFGEIPNSLLPFDYDAYASYPGRGVAVVTNVETGQAEYIPVPHDDRTFQVLRASCALPILFPVIEVGGRKYMDGGIADPIPAVHALSEGCDKVIAIVTRERGYVKEKEGALSLSARRFRKYPEFAQALNRRTDVYNECLRRLFELEGEGRVFIVAPDKPPNVSRTESDPVKLGELYDWGHRCVDELLPALREFIGDR